MESVLIASYLIALGILAIYGLHRGHLLMLHLRHRDDHLAPHARFEENGLPLVTVQLPIFNEMYVVERLLESVASLNYPADRLEIQVLDDSTDETTRIARAKVAELRERGIDVAYLHRTNRTGYKAGALEAGARSAKGELVMVFDADFVPGPAILREMIDYFTDPRVGMVQARWDHLNRHYSMLTECQSMFLDGHFVIEHAARNRSGRFFNFNGTAGIWRKTAIADAGGWQHDTVTEDMDLSFRAQLRGWRFVYLPDVVAPAELPCEMNGFKGQQFRWAKGSVQTGRKLLGRIFTAAVPLKVKLEAFFHLTNNFAYFFLMILALLQLPNMLLRQRIDHPELLLLDVPLFGATCVSIAAFYIVAHRALHGNVAAVLTRLPLMMALGIGLSLNNSRAVIEALFGEGVEFVRTPKHGVTDQDGGDHKRKRYTAPATLYSLVELALGAYFVATLILAVVTSSWASLPFVSLFAIGFLYVGGSSLAESHALNDVTGLKRRMWRRWSSPPLRLENLDKSAIPSDN